MIGIALLLLLVWTLFPKTIDRPSRCVDLIGRLWEGVVVGWIVTAVLEMLYPLGTSFEDIVARQVAVVLLASPWMHVPPDWGGTRS